MTIEDRIKRLEHLVHTLIKPEFCSECKKPSKDLDEDDLIFEFDMCEECLGSQNEPE